MVKPQLPEEVQLLLPEVLVWLINSYVPHLPKKPSPKSSPSLEKELTRLQNCKLKGKSAMYMYDLDDFVLDRYDC